MILTLYKIDLLSSEIASFPGNQVYPVRIDQLFSLDGVAKQTQKVGNSLFESFTLCMAILVAAKDQVGTGIVAAAGRLALGNNLLAHLVDSTFQIVTGFGYRSIGACCCTKLFGEEQTLIKRDGDQFRRGQAKGLFPDLLSLGSQIEFISNRRCNQQTGQGWQ